MAKIRVAFLNLGSLEWAGGLHYLKNLLYALSLVENSAIEPIVFVGNKSPNELVKRITPYATVIRSSIFDHRSPTRIISRLITRISGSNLIINSLLLKHNIQIVSHSDITGTTLSYKTINWIPDFQFLHLPEMFPQREILERGNLYKKLISDSDAVVVSSKDAKNDLLSFMPGLETKVRVLNFVSQVEPGSHHYLTDFCSIKDKYKLPEHFFYLPNQFWKHKNHKVVFEAVKILKGKDIDTKVICSGYMDDHRNRSHVAELKNSLKKNGLEKNIRFLGLIDYSEVFHLMSKSIAVINPSLFEGWSSTVEETKSMGKKIILSDIQVHREQAPANAIYFSCHNPSQLAGILAEQWAAKFENSGKLSLDRQQAAENLRKRTIIFGNSYHQIVMSLIART